MFQNLEMLDSLRSTQRPEGFLILNNLQGQVITFTTIISAKRAHTYYLNTKGKEIEPLARAWELGSRIVSRSCLKPCRGPPTTRSHLNLGYTEMPITITRWWREAFTDPRNDDFHTFYLQSIYLRPTRKWKERKNNFAYPAVLCLENNINHSKRC